MSLTALEIYKTSRLAGCAPGAGVPEAHVLTILLLIGDWTIAYAQSRIIVRLGAINAITSVLLQPEASYNRRVS